MSFLVRLLGKETVQCAHCAINLQKWWVMIEVLIPSLGALEPRELGPNTLNHYLDSKSHQHFGLQFPAPSKLCDSTVTRLQQSRVYDQSYSWPLELYSTKLSPSWPDKSFMSLYICSFKSTFTFTEGVLLIICHHLSVVLGMLQKDADMMRQVLPNFV